MAKIPGMFCKAYLGAALLASADAAGVDLLTWAEMGNLKDVTLNLSNDEADITTRANNGWKATMSTLKDGSVEFEMLWDTEDPNFTKIRNAWFTSGQLSAMFLSGGMNVEGSEGLVSNFSVTQFTRNEPLGEAVSVSVTLKPFSKTFWHEVEDEE